MHGKFFLGLISWSSAPPKTGKVFSTPPGVVFLTWDAIACTLRWWPIFNKLAHTKLQYHHYHVQCIDVIVSFSIKSIFQGCLFTACLATSTNFQSTFAEYYGSQMHISMNEVRIIQQEYLISLFIRRGLDIWLQSKLTLWSHMGDCAIDGRLSEVQVTTLLSVEVPIGDVYLDSFIQDVMSIQHHLV